MVELGRIDIYTETSMMSSHLELLQRGHLESLFHIFYYLKKHHNSDILFDTTDPDVYMADFQSEDWGLSIYGDVKEEITPIVLFAESGTGNMPDPRGQGFTMIVYVDCDIGGDCVTRRSRKVFYVFLNGSPIYWISAKQKICEVSTFGSEFTAMKQAIGYFRGLR